MSVPYSWSVHVQLRLPNGSTPTNQQISQIRAFESYGNTMQDLCGAGMDAGGRCTLYFGREKFYPPRTNPTLTIKVYDCKGALLHTQEFANVINNSTLKVTVGAVEDWRISGIVSLDSAPLTSGTVQLYDKFGGYEYIMGSATLSASGYYQINYLQSQFQHGSPRPYPELIVKVYDKSLTLLGESSVPYPPSNNQTFNVALIKPIPEKWQISGIVKRSDNSLIEKGIIHAYDVYESYEYILGTCALNLTGTYLVSYNSSQFQHGLAARPAPQLRLKIFDKNSQLLKESNFTSPPEVNQIFNITLPVI